MTTRDKKYFFWLIYWAVFMISYLSDGCGHKSIIYHVIMLLSIFISYWQIGKYDR